MALSRPKESEVLEEFLFSARAHRAILQKREGGVDDPWVRQMIRANIPEEFWGLNLEKMHRQAKNLSQRNAVKLVKKYVKKIQIARSQGFGFIFMGRNGVGKTSLQMEILKAALRRGFSAFYITLPNIFRQIYMGFRFPVVLAELQKILYTIDFVAIGELGKDYHRDGASMFAVSEFDTIFRERRQKCLPTLLDTNLNKGDLEEIYGSSLISLFASRLKVVRIDGPDFRRLNQQKEWNRFITGGEDI